MSTVDRRRFRLRQRDSCAQISLDHDEPLHATSRTAEHALVLIEETRPWGDTGAHTSPLLSDALRGRLDAVGVRVGFIR